MIRAVRTEDAEALSRLVREGYECAPGEVEEKVAEHERAVVWDEDGVLKGFAVVQAGGPPDKVTCMAWAYVGPEWRGQGIGSRLWAELEPVIAEREAKTVLVHARKEASGFFRQRGLDKWIDVRTMRYDGGPMPEADGLNVRTFEDGDFDAFWQPFSDAFYPLRSSVDARPARMTDFGEERMRGERADMLERKEDIFLYYEGGQLVGSAQIVKDYEIDMVWVHPQMQGRGHGRRIVQDIVNRMLARGISPIHLNVLGVNVSALTLYEKLGFQHVQTVDVSRRLR